MTLLEKAKRIPRAHQERYLITREHIELALAWAKGEISHSQVTKVRGKTKMTSYVFLARALAKYVRNGRT